MEYLIENGNVFEVGNTQTGTFKILRALEYELQLEYNPISQKIKATYIDWEGNIQTAYNGTITFELEGTKIDSQATKGVAEIDFTGVSGTYKISTVNTNIPNGRLVITID